MTLKEKVSEIMHENGMTMQEVSSAMGVSVTALSLQLKRGNPSLIKMQALANVLGVPVITLIEDDAEDDNQLTCPYCGKPIKFTAEKA